MSKDPATPESFEYIDQQIRKSSVQNQSGRWYFVSLCNKRAPSPKFRPILCCHKEAGGEHTVLPMSLIANPRWNRKQESFGFAQDKYSEQK